MNEEELKTMLAIVATKLAGYLYKEDKESAIIVVPYKKKTYHIHINEGEFDDITGVELN